MIEVFGRNTPYGWDEWARSAIELLDHESDIRERSTWRGPQGLCRRACGNQEVVLVVDIIVKTPLMSFSNSETYRYHHLC